jgi:SagB-type dehydrogenase family enzyme
MHRASSLAEPAQAASWREPVASESRDTAGQIDGTQPDEADTIIPLAPLPDADTPRDGIEDVIVRRASTRRFALKPISWAQLSTVLDRSTRGISADFLSCADSQLTDIYLIANRVEGLSAGSYYFDRQRGALMLLKRGDFHQEAAHLVLDQDLGGDAAATFFFMADLNPILARFGDRGYRAVQMESGIIGSKMYIAAYALGRGATGLTFYDDEVTEFFAPHSAGKSCILALAAGVPGKRPLM